MANRLLIILLVCSFRLLAATAENDWPAANPSKPPTDTQFTNTSADDLITFIVNEAGTEEWHYNSITACAQFMWITRDGEKGTAQRAKLADAIFRKLDTAESPHDIARLAGFLGPLRARDQI